VADASPGPAGQAEHVLTLSCPDRPGIVHAVTGVLVAKSANILDAQQYGSPTSGRFFLRIHLELAGSDEPALRGELDRLAAELTMLWQLHRADARPPVLVLVSKAGHCLADLLHRASTGWLPGRIAAVASNHLDLAGLAAAYSVPFHHLPVDDASRAEQEDRILDLVESTGAELVVLARYMQVLSAPFCEALTGRILNIHHSFLPSFRGGRPYEQAYSHGVKLIGATAHYVTADLDEGPILEQEVARVTHAHTPADLAATGRDLETVALARAVRWHLEHRVLLDGNRTVVFP
jgi:formyltetrahydrofolate deformylase